MKAFLSKIRTCIKSRVSCIGKDELLTVSRLLKIEMLNFAEKR